MQIAVAKRGTSVHWLIWFLPEPLTPPFTHPTPHPPHPPYPLPVTHHPSPITHHPTPTPSFTPYPSPIPPITHLTHPTSYHLPITHHPSPPHPTLPWYHSSPSGLSAAKSPLPDHLRPAPQFPSTAHRRPSPLAAPQPSNSV